MNATHTHDSRYEALADQDDATMMRDLREPAIETLIEDALALVPDWLRDELWNRDLDLKEMARCYVEAGEAEIRERCLQLNQEACEQ